MATKTRNRWQRPRNTPKADPLLKALFKAAAKAGLLDKLLMARLREGSQTAAGGGGE